MKDSPQQNLIWEQRGGSSSQTYVNPITGKPAVLTPAWNANFDNLKDIVVSGDDIITSTDASITRYDKESGSKRWETSIFDTESIEVTNPVSQLALHNNVIILNAWNEAKQSDELRGFDMESGSLLWQVELPEISTTPPLIWDGTCYIGTEAGIATVDAETGDRVWLLRLQDVEDIAVADDKLFVYAGDLRCYDAVKGGLHWQVTPNIEGLKQVCVSESSVLVGGDERIICYSKEKRDIEWQRELQVNVVGFSVTEEVLISGTNMLICLSEEDGRTLWEIAIAAMTIPVQTAEITYVTSLNTIRSIDTKTGDIQWNKELEEEIVAPPALSGKHIVQRTTDGMSVFTTEYEESNSADSVVQNRTDSSTDEDVETAKSTEKEDESESGHTVPSAESQTQKSPVDTNDLVQSQVTQEEIDTVAELLEADTDSLSDLAFEQTAGPLITFQGVHQESERAVIVRTVAPTDRNSESIEDAFRTGLKGWQNGHTHPNVREIVSWDNSPQPWIALPETSATPLHKLMGELDSEEIVLVITDVAEALRNVALYNGTHLNLTMEHILLASDAEGKNAVVDDWGLSRHVYETIESQYVTPYAAPEQLTSDFGSPGKHTDVYGLASIAYTLLTGEPPVEPTRDGICQTVPKPPSERSDVPPGVDDILRKGLAKNPNDRFDSVYHLGQAIKAKL